jgi:hypothetical protein
MLTLSTMRAAERERELLRAAALNRHRGRRPSSGLRAAAHRRPRLTQRLTQRMKRALQTETQRAGECS